jgi:nucleotide-binding universal stress UspA family protein
MIVKHGTAGDDLRRTIDRLAPDLVVMGTHGRKGVARLILGSVAEMLLNTSRCDMLVVRA